MSDDLNIVLSCLTFGCVVGCIVALLIMIGSFTYNKTLITENHAYYHPQTGNFTLKECNE